MLVVHATYDVMIQVSGVLDVEAAPAFTDCVAAAIADCPRHVVLEVSALEAVDAAGVACFAAALEAAKAHDIGIVLESPSDAVRAQLGARGRRRDLVVR